MSNRKVMQQALEALLWADAQGQNWQQVVKKAIKPIQEAAAQPEPVHDLYDKGFRRGFEMSSSYKEEAKAYKEAYFNLVKNVASMKAFEPTPPIVLYTPPQRKPLSDEQADQIISGLQTCHHQSSKREFLKVWLRDWAAHHIQEPKS